MSLFPIKNDSIDGTLNTPTDSVYKNGFRMNGDQVCMSTGAHASYSQGVSLDSNGAVRVVDATSGIPAGAQWQNGLLLNSTGALCYSSGAVGSWLNGLPMSSNGAHIANTLIPTPTRSFSFTTGVLDSAITFTRASGGTYTDSTGTLQLATSNTPRFDYDPVTLAAKGLLIEEQRTNLLTYSDQFNNVAWAKIRSSITADAATSPDGLTLADKLVEDAAANATHYCVQVLTLTANIYTHTVYLKASTKSWARVVLFDTVSTFGAYFDLSNGVVGSIAPNTSAAIVNVGNGWYKCSITTTTNVTAAAGCSVGIYLSNGNNGVSYTGDGTSGIYIWGAQLEAGSFATSYIPTTTAQATRAADVAVVTGTNFSSWYNQSEGTVFVEGDVVYGLSNFPTITTFSDGTTNNRFIQYQANSGIYSQVVSGGVNQGDIGRIGTPVSGSTFKFATGLILNNTISAWAGTLGSADTSVTLPIGMNQLRFGATQVGTQMLNGTIKSLAYWNTRLTNTQLQTITT